MDLPHAPRKKRETKEPDIVPILDALVALIFFLLVSTSFMEIHQLEIPRVKKESSDEISREVPLSPRLRAVSSPQSQDLTISFDWVGKSPGKISREVKDITSIKASIEEMTKEFAQNHPKEQSIEISASSEVHYQILISMMDGAKAHFKDIVLSPPEEISR